MTSMATRSPSGTRCLPRGVFDPVTSILAAAASLEGDRAEHVATILNNGQALVTGGIEGFQEL